MPLALTAIATLALSALALAGGCSWWWVAAPFAGWCGAFGLIAMLMVCGGKALRR